MTRQYPRRREYIISLSLSQIQNPESFFSSPSFFLHLLREKGIKSDTERMGKKLPRRGEEIARRSPPPPSLSLSSSSPLFSAAKSSRAASDALTMAPGTRPPSRSSRRRVCLYGKTLFRRRRLRRQRSSSRRRLSLRLRVISLGRASRRHCVARSRRRLRTLSLPPSLPPRLVAAAAAAKRWWKGGKRVDGWLDGWSAVRARA